MAGTQAEHGGNNGGQKRSGWDRADQSNWRERGSNRSIYDEWHCLPRSLGERNESPARQGIAEVVTRSAACILASSTLEAGFWWPVGAEAWCIEITTPRPHERLLKILAAPPNSKHPYSSLSLKSHLSSRSASTQAGFCCRPRSLDLAPVRSSESQNQDHNILEWGSQGSFLWIFTFPNLCLDKFLFFFASWWWKSLCSCWYNFYNFTVTG
jgi:hypothetical protein